MRFNLALVPFLAGVYAASPSGSASSGSASSGSGSSSSVSSTALSSSSHGSSSSASGKTYTWSLDNQVKPTYTAPKAFPTGEFPGMYFTPKSQEAQPRPIVTAVDGSKFPDSLNDPSQVPTSIPDSEGTLPKAQTTSTSSNFVDDIVKNVTSVFDGNQTWCDKCKAALPIGKNLALAKPDTVPGVLIDLCKKYNYHRYGKNPNNNLTCEQSYTKGGQGGTFAQLLAYADFSEESTDPSTVSYTHL